MNSSTFSLNQTNSVGFGEIADIVMSHYCDARDHQQYTVTFGEPYIIMRNQLYDVSAECSASNWDGYNAIPVSPAATDFARFFITCIPIDFPTPDISADPDGFISFEWYKAPRCLVSVSIGQDGIIYYAALMGENRIHGKESFDGTFPQNISKIISEVFKG